MPYPTSYLKVGSGVGHPVQEHLNTSVSIAEGCGFDFLTSKFPNIFLSQGIIYCLSLTLVFLRVMDFFLSLQNQKESDLSHLSNIPDILPGHFKETKNGDTNLPGVRVAIKDQWVGRWLPPEKIKNRHFVKVIVDMVLKLIVYVSVIFFFHNQVKFRFLAKFSIYANDLLRNRLF